MLQAAFMYVTATRRPSQSLLYSGLSNPSSQLVSIGGVFQPPDCSHGSPWTHSRIGVMVSEQRGKLEDWCSCAVMLGTVLLWHLVVEYHF